MSTVPSGWYPDPATPEGQPPTRERFWDGTQWTQRVRDLPPLTDPTLPSSAPPGAQVPPAGPPPPAQPVGVSRSAGRAERPPVPASFVDPGPAVDPETTDPGRQRSGRGSVIALTAASVVVLAVLVVGAIWWAGVDVAGTSGDPGSAESDLDVASSDATDVDASVDPVEDGEDPDPATDPDPDPHSEDDPDATSDAPEPAAPVDLDDLDPGSLSVRVSVGSEVEQVTLSDGQAELADGSRLTLVNDLVVRGELTGDGREQLALLFDVVRDEQVRPGVAIVGIGAGGEVESLDPPTLTVQRTDEAVSPVGRGFVDAASIVDGGLELGLVAAVEPGAGLVVRETRGDPYADNLQAEMRYDLVGDSWSATPDGPVTRAAREHAASFYGVRFDDVLRCDGRADVRGRHPWCQGPVQADQPDYLFVAMLIVDDRGGFRSVLGRDGPLHSAQDVRSELGPGEHFCRDIAAEAQQSPIGWELPMAAISYWFDEGMPERMDASRNGIPCQTVFDGVAEFLGGSDGRVSERYARQRSGPG